MTQPVPEIAGSLVFDSWIERGPELRSRIFEDRHLIYEGGGVILDLLMKQAGNGTCLQVGGQVLPESPSSSNLSDLAVLLETGKDRTYTRTNALGEFMFHKVQNGSFDLAIILQDRRFVVRGLSCNEPRRWRVVEAENGGR